MADIREELGNIIFEELVYLTSRPSQRNKFLSFDKEKLSLVREVYERYKKLKVEIELLTDFLYYYDTYSEMTKEKTQRKEKKLLLTYFGYNNLFV